MAETKWLVSWNDAGAIRMRTMTETQLREFLAKLSTERLLETLRHLELTKQ